MFIGHVGTLFDAVFVTTTDFDIALGAENYLALSKSVSVTKTAPNRVPITTCPIKTRFPLLDFGK